VNKLIIFVSSLAFIMSDGISGVAYFTYDDNFSISRTYFTYKKTVSDDLSFKFQTDIGALKDNDDTRYTAYVKKAHFDWRLNGGVKMSMGMIGMNMFNVQEKTWGYRFITKSAMDLNKFSSSADLGLSLSKKFGNLLHANLTISNGEGYKKSGDDVDENSKVSIQLVNGQKRLDKKDGYNIGLAYSTVSNDNDEETTVMGLFGGWSGMGLRAGVEYNMETVVELENSLTSLYVNYNVNKNLSAFVRQDNYDEDVNVDGGDESVMLAGIVWAPTKGLSICPHITQADDEDTFAFDIQIKF